MAKEKEEKANQQLLDKEPVDFETMFQEPVPFGKFKGTVYKARPLTIAEAREYAKSLYMGPPYLSVAFDETRDNLIKVFNSHVTDGDGKPVKFEDVEQEWPDEAVNVFIRALLRISG